MRRTINIEKLKELLLQGLNDTEIGDLMGESHQTVSRVRAGLGIGKNFRYESKLDKDRLKELYDQGFSDSVIARKLGNCTHNGVYYWRKKLGLKANPINKNSIIITPEQHQILIGGVLGDSYVSPSRANSKLVFAHSTAQTEYFMWKYEKLKPLTHKFTTKDLSSPRYKNPVMEIRTNTKSYPELNYYRSLFYNESGRKILPKLVMETIEPLGLAVWFMDDGMCGGSLCTNAFTKDDLEVARLILKERFNLEYTIHKDNGLYLKTNSLNLFKHLVEPYILPSMQYKLIRKTVLKKSQKLLETP